MFRYVVLFLVTLSPLIFQAVAHADRDILKTRLEAYQLWQAKQRQSPRYLVTFNPLERTPSEVRQLIESRSTTIQIRRQLDTLLHGYIVEGKGLHYQQLASIAGVTVHEDTPVFTALHESVEIVRAPMVWQMQDLNGLPLEGHGVKVAIIDTGIDYKHPDFNGLNCHKIAPDCKVIAGYDFINQDADPMDDQGHGTHVAGIVASNPILPTGYKGVAPHAKLMAYKVLDAQGSGSMFDVIAGIEQAYKDGADIMNLSLGTLFEDPIVRDAVDKASELGVVMVVAAGNLGPFYGTIGSPGDAEKAITVGASTKLDEIAEFSARQTVSGSVPKPDLVAPGVDILSTKLSGGSMKLSGTSMASPHVAGLAALLLQYTKEMPPKVLKARLMQGAKRTSLENSFARGVGIADIQKSVEAKTYISPGQVYFGRLNQKTREIKQKRVITIHNASDTIQRYGLSLEKDLPEGVSAYFKPFVFVPPGGTVGVTLYLRADLALYKAPNKLPAIYENALQITPSMTEEKLDVPIVFGKSHTLTVEFLTPKIGFVSFEGEVHKLFLFFGGVVHAIPGEYVIQVEDPKTGEKTTKTVVVTDEDVRVVFE